MKKTIIKYGLLGVATMFVLASTTYIIFSSKPNYETQEVLGYATIVLSLVFVYFGIRRWRDKENGGQLSFGKGLGIGTLISLFPSIAFGLFTLIEMHLLDPDFSQKYYSYYEAKIRQSTPPEELSAALKKLDEGRELFSSPVAQFGLMFLTVFVIGFIITIISTLILRRNKQ